MTRKEAIERIKWYFEEDDGISAEDITKEAIDMAIEALENKPTPCEKCIHVKSCRKVIILKNRTYKLVRYCSQGAERKKPLIKKERYKSSRAILRWVVVIVCIHLRLVGVTINANQKKQSTWR